jgi:hypothetical protein
MKLKPLKSIATFLIATCAYIDCATAQNSSQITTPNESKTSCLNAKSIRAPQLYGIWQVTFTNPPAGLPASAVMLLERHEEFSDSLAGTLSRVAVTANGHSAKAALAGDVEDGFVILDNSSNNISISGTWNGELVEASCGREVKGMWKDTSASAPPDAPNVPFTMIKQPAW